MKPRVPIALSVLLAALFLFPGPGRGEGASGSGPVLFVLDASGSMAEAFGDVPRMVAARVLLSEQINRLPAAAEAGLVAYGNQIPGCRSTRIYAPIRRDNRASLQSQVSTMVPAGATPLGATLRLIRETILPSHPGTRIIVISDGAESCGGNPVSEAQRIRAAGGDVRINVIGLDVNGTVASELSSIAGAGAGQYFDVHNHTDFAAAIQSSIDPNYIAQIPFQPAAPTNTHPTEIPMLEILSAHAERRDTGPVLIVSYRFRASRHGNYHVAIKAVQRPATPGPTSRIEGRAGLAGVDGSSYFAVDRGDGTLELELPVAALRGPIYVQGELWDTTDVPDHLYVSNHVQVGQ